MQKFLHRGKRIDRVNSSHLAVSGPPSPAFKGIDVEIMFAHYIVLPMGYLLG